MKEKELYEKIYTIRGQKVMLDKDLAGFYKVETKVLNQAVRRNLDRFPTDFMFKLSKEEFENLKSQFVTSSHGGTRKFPFAFTEHGIAMLSGILRSDVAVQVNILIIRAFIDLRKKTVLRSDYMELKDAMAVLAAKIESVESNNLVDKMVVSGKVMQLSKDVRTLTDIFNQFQQAYVVIKRPEDGFENE